MLVTLKSPQIRGPLVLDIRSSPSTICMEKRKCRLAVSSSVGTLNTAAVTYMIHSVILRLGLHKTGSDFRHD